MILDMKSYLYQTYMYTISHPQVILVALGIWFILCGFMEWKGKAKKGKNIVFIIWKALVWLGLSGCVIMFLYVTLCNRYQAPDLRYKLQIFWSYREVIEYSCAVKPHVRSDGNRQSGTRKPLSASLLA